MYITIKNIEALQNHLQKQGKPLKGVVVDLEQVVNQDFTQLFFDACDEYAEVDESYLQGTCKTCKYNSLNEFEEPCNSCIASDEIIPTKWKPKEPTLKEATEHMKSEFDVIRGEGKYVEKPYAQIEREYVDVNKFKKRYKCPFCKSITGKPVIYNGAWYECESCGEHIYIPKEV